MLARWRFVLGRKIKQENGDTKGWKGKWYFR